MTDPSPGRRIHVEPIVIPERVPIEPPEAPVAPEPMPEREPVPA